MRPASPVLPGEGHTLFETLFAENQPQYGVLPAIKYGDTDGTVLSRWKLSWRERLRVLIHGDIYHTQLTFNQGRLQPILLQTTVPERETGSADG